MDWPPEFFTLKDGIGCPMCANSGRDDNGHGVRFLTGRVSDAYLQRVALQPGYAVVVWRGPHVAEPTQLSEGQSGAYWADVLDAAKAIEHHFQPVKMNYQTLGNALPHLHTHVIPRYKEDPSPGMPLPFPAPGEDLGVLPEDDLQAVVRELSNFVRSSY